MKRQKGGILGNASNTATAESKGKKAAEKRCKEVVELTGMRHSGDSGLTEEVVTENWDKWLWPWPWGDMVVVDEQMSWGTCWHPCWDVEIMGWEAYNELYSDVLWEDDVWDLKQIKDVPIGERSSIESGDN